MDFQLNFVIELIPKILKYFHVTMEIAILSLVISLIISVFLAAFMYYKVKVLAPLTKIYISFFRGTPLIAQLYFMYFGVFQTIPLLRDFDPLMSSVIALSLNTAAFMAELVRGSIMSVEKGQFEACASIGMNNVQAMIRIVIPQAARTAIPGLWSNFMGLIKGTSLAFTIGVTEMMSRATLESSATYRFFECYAAVIVIYWAIDVILGFGQKYIEKKLNEAY